MSKEYVSSDASERSPVAAQPKKDPVKGKYAKGKGEEMQEDDDEEEEMEKKGYKKSLDLEASDLEKSLDKLADYAGQAPESRKEALLSKAQGEELSKSETAELFGLLGGDEVIEASLGDEIVKGFEGNDTLQKALDVSDYLQENQAELCKSLAVLGEHVEKSDSRQHEFNLVLAKAVADVGNLVKSVSERIHVIEAQPAHAPKSQARPLQKSFRGQEEDQLSKGDLLDTMEDMMKSSQDGLTTGGEDILKAISKAEIIGQVSPSMMAAIQDYRSRARH